MSLSDVQKRPRSRKSQKKVQEDVPSLVLDSAADREATTQRSKWEEAYVPSPVVAQSTILLGGIAIFALATVWPPLILLVAYVASKLIPYAYRTNDDASSRRVLFADFSRDDQLPQAFRQEPDHIRLDESYWVNERGMTLYTLVATPRHRPIEAVVCFCHGYTDTVSFMKQVEHQRLVEEGIAFVAIEYEGHGRSDGAFGLINNFDVLVKDVGSFYSEITSTRFAGKPAFLMGESMGGAVAFSVYRQHPRVFKGVVFVCPMCKISEDMLPPQWVVDVLTWMIGPTGERSTSWLGYLPIAPARQSLGEVAHKLEHKRTLNERSPLLFGRNPRLATARELIRVTQEISASMREFNAPFLVQHGLDDRVTDPALSKALYEESPSADKTIRLYPGMWHGLTSTEPDDNINKVFGDSIEWILSRAKKEQ